jgi:hypothetical protein
MCFVNVSLRYSPGYDASSSVTHLHQEVDIQRTVLQTTTRLPLKNGSRVHIKPRRSGQYEPGGGGGGEPGGGGGGAEP